MKAQDASQPETLPKSTIEGAMPPSSALASVPPPRSDTMPPPPLAPVACSASTASVDGTRALSDVRRIAVLGGHHVSAVCWRNDLKTAPLHCTSPASAAFPSEAWDRAFVVRAAWRATFTTTAVLSDECRSGQRLSKVRIDCMRSVGCCPVGRLGLLEGGLAPMRQPGAGIMPAEEVLLAPISLGAEVHTVPYGSP
jgi:hypothetical protein